MKKIVLPLFISIFIFTGFSFIVLHTSTVLPLCGALAKVMKEEPTEFAAIKGALISEVDGTKTYNSKVLFDGWLSSEYSFSDGAISVDVQSTSTTKEKATTLFNTTSKQLAACLEMEGAVLQGKGIDELIIFTKSKVDVALMLITKEGKSFVMISISRES